MKVTGWEVLLAAAVDDARSRSFTWGTHDCATWAFDLRRDLIGGDDTAAHWRGRYRTARGAARVMRRLGWSSMRQAGTALLGVPLADVRLAQRGDLVLSPDASSFGVCLGAQVAFLAPEGLTLRALSSCALAWRI
ncbi:MAG: hypothetical protein A3D16_20725 [Rhodobacterales bacterium RIFCSPHIGHO2_02_FULL_62_130]|nr:MAG: hypothetical protein A3D16_20725 [Rhodobacterales bacterium RIFCSPHIGHO2_02_FULL_62_130]OHC58186.1 MAG: hypothetical protein A3E48_12375 [Rhodobacterales bacterium RIFCSPHIGHO2_12_FULL_62_75]HCY99803.1 hypothetical protein [Rhodobacter sp.]